MLTYFPMFVSNFTPGDVVRWWLVSLTRNSGEVSPYPDIFIT